jgi:hypothetical protein
MVCTLMFTSSEPLQLPSQERDRLEQILYGERACFCCWLMESRCDRSKRRPE